MNLFAFLYYPRAVFMRARCVPARYLLRFLDSLRSKRSLCERRFWSRENLGQSKKKERSMEGVGPEFLLARDT